MLIEYVSLIGGLVVLIVAGDVLVRGSVGIAEKLGIPTLVIGLTIVAFGTSAPELVISLGAALDGLPGIAVGNVVGSNIANVLAVLGLPALFAATACCENGATRNAIFMVAVTGIFIGMAFHSPISRLDGGILLLLLAVFLWDSVRATRKHRAQNAGAAAVETGCCDDDTPFEEVEGVPESPALAILFVVLGMIGLPLGAHFTIEGASALARNWGVSDAVIGLTVVALGTSLPELMTSPDGCRPWPRGRRARQRHRLQRLQPRRHHGDHGRRHSRGGSRRSAAVRPLGDACLRATGARVLGNAGDHPLAFGYHPLRIVRDLHFHGVPSRQGCLIERRPHCVCFFASA